MKKGMFSMMNYYLPLKGIASMHCSANTDLTARTPRSSSACPAPARPPSPPTRSACLSATTSTAGTTTASSTSRAAATPRSSTSTRIPSPTSTTPSSRNALLENVTLDKDGKIDFADKSVTENTRVSYPINHIKNIVRPISSAPAAKKVIFLSADAFGVLPPCPS
jgi:phosphoenolpyruvate carboxykinase (ATP)